MTLISPESGEGEFSSKDSEGELGEIRSLSAHAFAQCHPLLNRPHLFDESTPVPNPNHSTKRIIGFPSFVRGRYFVMGHFLPSLPSPQLQLTQLHPNSSHNHRAVEMPYD